MKADTEHVEFFQTARLAWSLATDSIGKGSLHELPAPSTAAEERAAAWVQDMGRHSNMGRTKDGSIVAM